MAEIDWTGTVFGDADAWPVSLITTMGIVLGSRKPMAAWWGPRLLQLYNDAYGSMLGDRHPGALGEPAQSTWRDVWSRIRGEAERVLAGAPSGFTEHVVVPAGARAPQHTLAFCPIRGEQPQPSGVLVTCEPEDPWASGERTRAILDGAPAAIAVLDAEADRVVLSNARYSQLSGRRSEELIGRSIRDAFPELAGTPALEILDGVKQTGRAVRHPEFEMAWDRDRNGRLVTGYFDWTCQPVRAHDGTIAGTAHFMFDVTDKVVGRSAADAATARALAADRCKDEFVAMLGHELRNPLSTIVAALDSMRRRRGDCLEQQVLDRQVGALARLVDDLLDVSRIARGQIELRRCEIELADVVARAIEASSERLEHRGHRLALQIPTSGLPLFVDPGRIAQVIANLLTNAAKYSPPGTRIAITAWRSAGWVLVAVKDDGVGIPPHDLDRVFEGVQLPHTLELAQGGLGLGLKLVRSFVEQHGGTVTAYSEGRDKGSEFVVRLPAADAFAHDPARAAEPLPEPVRPAVAGTRVLVVDDNEDAVAIVRQALEDRGYQVEVAYHGGSALEVAARFEPQIALIDIALPGIDGYELARRLRERWPASRLRLIAMTGFSREVDRGRSTRVGFARYLVKPFDLSVLESALSD